MMSPRSVRPRLTVVVVVYKMRREAPRTLFSLSAAYQQGIEPGEYEVIVVENDSAEALSEEQVAAFGENFRYFRPEVIESSPVHAINTAVSQARGELIGILIDGARILTPGVLRLGLGCLSGFPDAVVGTLGFHLGPATQHRSPRRGYNRAREDKLLESIDWRNHGYRLFEIAALAPSSRWGWFLCPIESSCLFISKATFNDLGGYDPAFDLPGGGMANIDFWVRACSRPSAPLILLLGEGSFHQLHGGIMSNASGRELRERLASYSSQYLSLRGKPASRPDRIPLLFGTVPENAQPWLSRSHQLLLWYRVLAAGSQVLRSARRLVDSLRGLF